MSLSSLLSRKQQAAAPAQAPQDSDAVTRQAWCITPAAWAGMTDQERVWHRWNVTKAPNFGK